VLCDKAYIFQLSSNRRSFRLVSTADIFALPPIDPAWAPIGERVRSLREARGITQEQLAREMRLDRRTLACAERGRARLTSGQLYAATLALHVPMRLLFEPTLDTAQLRRFSPPAGG
jgi:DNA-binding XRE family transcriptional regulator